MEKVDTAALFASGTFRFPDRVTGRARTWQKVLAPLRATATDVLEIGSLEGRSALFFLQYLPAARLTCVDPFYADGLEATFDANLAGFAGRLEKIVDFSFPALIALRHAKRTFDIVYIDGAHEREAVLLDSVLAWPLVRAGGVCIWDDYGKYGQDKPPATRPKEAIDGFLTAYAGDYEELHRGSQLIVRKTADGPYPALERTRRGTGARRKRRSILRRILRRRPR